MSARVRTDRRARLIGLNARLRACRRCHAAGFLDESVSWPVARDPEPDAPIPRILLIGQAPGPKGGREPRPFSGTSGDRLRDWFERGGIARADFYRKISFGAVTRCFPGPAAGSKGDRVPSPAERVLCRPWLDGHIAAVRPEVILLVGMLATRTFLGRFAALSDAVGAAVLADGVRYLPLPHPSGVSRWLNEPANVEAVGRAMDILRGWVDELNL